MILTGPEIKKQVDVGLDRAKHKTGVGTPADWSTMDAIHIDPFDPSLVGPNSVDLRLGNELLVYAGVTSTFKSPRLNDPDEVARYLQNPVYQSNYDGVYDGALDIQKPNETYSLKIPKTGLKLRPGILYLGRTVECIGSNKFVPIVEGRSSVGRLGIHVHVTAGFCDIGFKGTITLEIHVIHPVIVYPNIPICQAYFLTPKGEIELYKGRYQNQEEPTASRFGLKMDKG